MSTNPNKETIHNDGSSFLVGTTATVVLLLLFGVGIYASNSKNSEPANASANQVADTTKNESGADNYEAGKTAYATCAACHGADGKGMQAGPALMAPSLIGADLAVGDPDKALLIVLKGIAKEDQKFMGQMMPLGATLDDATLAAVLTYVRKSWGNDASEITTEQAAAARAKFQSINAPAGVKRADIDKLVAETP